jgi:hypothetical protein
VGITGDIIRSSNHLFGSEGCSIGPGVDFIHYIEGTTYPVFEFNIPQALSDPPMPNGDYPGKDNYWKMMQRNAEP